MNTNVKILIVEDEVLIANFLKNELAKEGFLNVEMAHNKTNAQKAFKQISPHIILMDINLDGHYEGIELAKEKNEQAKVIFLTAQSDINTIRKALEVTPESYLTKPIKKSDLIAAINICISKQKRETIVVKNGFKEEVVRLSEILYCKADGNYVDIFTKEHRITLRQPLNQLKKQLTNDFIQIHRSVIVNKNAIQKKTASKVYIQDKELPISRAHMFEI